MTEGLGEGRLLYKVNYDNAYRAGQRGDVAKDVVTEKYILGMRILMMGFERAIRTVGQSAEEEEG